MMRNRPAGASLQAISTPNIWASPPSAEPIFFLRASLLIGMLRAVTPHLGKSFPVRRISAPFSGRISLTGQYFPKASAAGSLRSQKYR